MMNLLIPIDSKDYEDAVISNLNDNIAWVIIEMDNGNVIKSVFYDSREEITDYIDYIVVKSKDEPVDEFIDEGIDILLAALQKNIDDIVEAFMFRELHEIGS